MELRPFEEIKLRYFILKKKAIFISVSKDYLGFLGSFHSSPCHWSWKLAPPNPAPLFLFLLVDLVFVALAPLKKSTTANWDDNIPTRNWSPFNPWYQSPHRPSWHRLWHASFKPLSGLAQSTIRNPSIQGIYGIKVLYCTLKFNCHRVSEKYSPDKCQVLG